MVGRGRRDKGGREEKRSEEIYLQMQTEEQ